MISYPQRTTGRVEGQFGCVWHTAKLSSEGQASEARVGKMWTEIAAGCTCGQLIHWTKSHGSSGRSSYPTQGAAAVSARRRPVLQISTATIPAPTELQTHQSGLRTGWRHQAPAEPRVCKQEVGVRSPTLQRSPNRGRLRTYVPSHGWRGSRRAQNQQCPAIG